MNFVMSRWSIGGAFLVLALLLIGMGVGADTLADGTPYEILAMVCAWAGLAFTLPAGRRTRRVGR